MDRVGLKGFLFKKNKGVCENEVSLVALKIMGVNKQKRMRLLLRLPLEPFATDRTT